MFSHITQNWRGRPLVSHEVIIQLIANTTTQNGLKIRAELDDGHYPTGIKVTDAELARLNLKRDNFHGEWNYTLMPERKKYSQLILTQRLSLNAASSDSTILQQRLLHSGKLN